ncbi:MAG: M67 family metallopeptidase [Ruminococcus sp.]|nr:M67 family metallopeptidase [Ruminococcus sp.]
MLYISQELILQIKSKAERAYPNECCGFIFGSLKNSGKYAEYIAASTNSSAADEQYHRFIITPDAMMNAERFARSNGWDIVGFYHSHPDCPAVPSEFDTANALPVYSYIIVSAVKGKAEALLSWELDRETDYTQFQSETIILTKENYK